MLAFRTKVTITVVLFALITSAFTSQIAHAEKKTLTVFAAASLSESFTKLSKDFKKFNPNINVRFSFLASSTLAMQLNQGAPADLFVSASITDMTKARSRISLPVLFVSNQVVVGVPKFSTKKIFKPQDLNQKGILWIQCSHSAPCGVASDSALKAEKLVTSKPVSLEANVSAVVAKLLSGSVDAGICYQTDIVANVVTLRGIAFRNKTAATTKYQIGVVDDSKSPEEAKMLLQFLSSASSLEYLKQRGFGVNI